MSIVPEYNRNLFPTDDASTPISIATVAPPVSNHPGTKRSRHTAHRSFINRDQFRIRPRYRFGQKCCGCCFLPNSCYPFKFLLGLFNCKGTVMLKTFPQIFLAVGWAFGVKILHNRWPITIPGVFWTPLYTVTVFLGVFRTNLAFQQYKAGRGHLGAMVTALSNAMRFAVSINNTNENSVNVHRVGNLINVVAAMIRIDIRESKLPQGKKRAPRPGTNEFKQWKKKFNSKFGSSTTAGPTGSTGVYWADHDSHASPKISDLLTLKEIELYSNIDKSSQRVILSTTLLMKEFAGSTNTIALATLEDHVIAATAAWRGMAKIIDSPMPFSYGHLMHLMLFLTFVFGTPVAIMCNDAIGWYGIGMVWFSTFLMYGLEEMASEIENPFGWDENDHDLTRFCRKLNVEVNMLTKVE